MDEQRSTDSRAEERPEARPRPSGESVAKDRVRHAVRRAEGCHAAHELEGAANREPADLEPVVGRRTDDDRIGQHAENQHHEPPADPADDDPGEGAGGRPDE